MLWEIQPPKWHSVCGRCTGFTELSENDEVSFPDCCCLYRCFFLFVGSSVDASILQGVARSGHLLQRCGCIIDGGFFRLMLQGQENKNGLHELIPPLHPGKLRKSRRPLRIEVQPGVASRAFSLLSCGDLLEMARCQGAKRVDRWLEDR